MSRNAYPIVLTHGCPQHSLMWHAIAPQLATSFDVLAYDQRGMGLSTITSGGFDGTSLAADLKKLLDLLEIEQAHLVGYDLGGQTAVSIFVGIDQGSNYLRGISLADAPLDVGLLAGKVDPPLVEPIKHGDASFRVVHALVTEALLPGFASHRLY